jgi:hypothetical protein
VEGDRVSWSPGGYRLAVTTPRGRSFSEISVFSLSLSLQSLAAQSVAFCLRGLERRAVGQLEIPDTLKGQIRLLL